MTDTDPTITIAGHEARIEALSEALHDAHRAFADVSTSARKMDALNAAVTAERDALAAQLAGARAELSRRAADWDALALRADLASARAALYRSQRDEAEIRGALAKVADAIGCGHSADAVAEAIGKLAARASAAEAEAARLTAECDQARADDQQKDRVAALEARPVLTEERLAEALTSLSTWRGERMPWADGGARMWATDLVAQLNGPVTLPLPSQDPADVFARVNEYDLGETIRVAYADGERGKSFWTDIARAVLARLRVTLVAPVDPEAIDRDLFNRIADTDPKNPRWESLRPEAKRLGSAAMRAVLIARGIPVTPERGQ